MKPRIFISMHYMEIGGAETSLIGLLHALDPERVDVDLFLHAHRGEMMRFIPGWVNLLPEVGAYAMIERKITAVLKTRFVPIAFARILAKVLYRFYSMRKRPIDGSAVFGYVGRCVTPLLPSLRHLGEYDIAISFLTPHNIVLDKVSARKKMCWIHTDYSCVDVNRALELPVWSGYDHVVSISADVTNTFLQVFPSLQGKVVEIENILSPVFVRRRAGEFDAASEITNVAGGVTLLSVGRYCAAKNYDNVPDICRRLVALGVGGLKWYIIGYGGDEEPIKRKIAEAGMEEHVILLGKKANPYPYIKACDWYVQPSRYEGKSVTVREAQVLCKPVIVTAYPTAASQVHDGVDGVIVPLDNERCARSMATALRDNRMKERLVAHLSTHDYGNMAEVEKVYRLMA